VNGVAPVISQVRNGWKRERRERLASHPWRDAKAKDGIAGWVGLEHFPYSWELSELNQAQLFLTEKLR
jgi:hypothetical protein